MGLTKEQVAAALEGEPNTRQVPVPELGGSVTVRELPGTLRNQFEVAAATQDVAMFEKVTLNIVATCTLDDDGGRLLDMAMVRRMYASKARAFFRLRDAIIAASAVDDDDLESLAENFEVAPSDGSSSDSPDISE